MNYEDKKIQIATKIIKDRYPHLFGLNQKPYGRYLSDVMEYVKSVYPTAEMCLELMSEAYEKGAEHERLISYRPQQNTMFCKSRNIHKKYLGLIK